MKKRSAYSWLSLILGILVIILAVYMMFNPTAALNAAIILLAIMVIAEGIMDIYAFFRFSRFTGFGPVFSLISGILLVVLGVLMLFNVLATAMVISLLLPIIFILRCIARLVNLGIVKRLAGNGMFWLLLILNVLGIILGIVMLLNPVTTLTVIPIVFSFYLLVLGIESIVVFFSGLGDDNDLV